MHHGFAHLQAQSIWLRRLGAPGLAAGSNENRLPARLRHTLPNLILWLENARVLFLGFVSKGHLKERRMGLRLVSVTQ